MRFRGWQYMNKEETIGIEPLLRFKQDDGSTFLSWKIVKLKDLAKRNSVKNKRELVTRVLTNSAAEGVLDQRDYFDKDIAVKGNLQGYYVVEENDYVYNPRISTLAPVGPISKNKIGQGLMSPLYTVFSLNEEDDNFYEQYFKSSKWHNYLKSISNVGARHDRMSISAADFMEMPIPIPSSTAERKKISMCLSSIDELIDNQTQKMESLNLFRRGLMEELFPSEGETVPKRRFSEFKIREPWKKEPFSKLFKIGGGKAHKHLADGDIPVYGSGGYMRSANDYLYDGESACIGRKGTINKPIFLTGKFWTVDTLFYTHGFKDCLPKFVYLLFQNINWLALNEAGGVPSLSKVIINNVEVMIPEIDEQQKIVDCIFSLDEIIQQQKNKLDFLAKHKRGLMQQLFPCIETI